MHAVRLDCMLDGPPKLTRLMIKKDAVDQKTIYRLSNPSMTMDIGNLEVEYLSDSIFQKQDPVTFHTLSRKLKIHHAQAKRALYEFYTANRDKVSANFVVTGVDFEGNTKIKLCDDSTNDDKLKELFKHVHGVHVYCLKNKSVTISDAQLAVHERSFPVDYTSLAEYYKSGLIQGPKLTVKDNSVVRVPVANRSSTPVKKEPSPSDVKKSEPKLVSAGLTSGYVSRKAGATAGKKQQPTADITSGYVSRKTEKTPPVLAGTSPAPSSSKTGYQYKSRKAEKNQPKERVVVSSHQDEPEDLEDISVAKQKKAKSEELQKLFEDDDSDFSDDTEDVIKAEPIVVEHPIELHKEEGNPQEAEQTELVEPEKNHSEPESEPDHQASAPEQTEAEPEVESYVDEDGYLVTVNKKKKSPVPSSRPVKRASSPLPSTSSKDPKKKRTGQSSLMNFFQSKKA